MCSEVTTVNDVSRRRITHRLVTTALFVIFHARGGGGTNCRFYQIKEFLHANVLFHNK